MDYIPPTTTHAMVLCADCGTPIPPSSANLCLSCLRNSVDITEGIPKQATINFCRNCERYLNPPQSWVLAQLESRELLAICLRKLKGLNKVRLVDAGFIWTEPHSKRLKVKLTVQKEVSYSDSVGNGGIGLGQEWLQRWPQWLTFLLAKYCAYRFPSKGLDRNDLTADFRN